MFHPGGGVTASGGEPLIQVKFLIELFKKLKENNIHTALDTSGSIEINSNIQELLKYTDLVLLDIKHIDDEKCKELTGFSNKNTLNFARFLSNNNITTWIRQVIIPGITDNPDDLKKLKGFLSTLKTVQKIDLIPYHSIGKYKWENLGFDYPLKEVLDATDEDIKKARCIM